MSLDIEEMIKVCNEDPCHKQIGIEATKVSKEEAICYLHIKDWHLNLAKVLHGGILFSVIDTAMGFSVYPHLQDNERILAIDIKINYLKPAFLEMKKLKCHGVLVSRTSRLAVAEGEILSPDGEILCKALGTFAILTGPLLIKGDKEGQC